jgi:hypothetical protein
MSHLHLLTGATAKADPVSETDLRYARPLSTSN